MESWKSDKYSQGRYRRDIFTVLVITTTVIIPSVMLTASTTSLARYKRGSSSSSGGGTERPRAGRRGEEEGPYQSGLYDRWHTVILNCIIFVTAIVITLLVSLPLTLLLTSWKTEWNPTYRDYQTSQYPHATSSYMTKGGRR